MKVNLYDSPAQAHFIDTYVPIQFENLYRVSEKAQKNLDEVNALQDDVVNNYSSLNTFSDADRSDWDQNVYGKVRSWVDANASDANWVKDPIKQAEYKSMIRSMKSDSNARNMLANAQAGKDYIKASDPRWGDYEKDKFRNFSSRENGAFTEENLPWMSREQIFDPLFSKLNDKGTRLDTSDSVYDRVGWSKKETDPLLLGSINDLKTNPILMAQIDQAEKAGKYGDKYYKTNENGTKELDLDKVIYDEGRPVAAQKEWTSESINPLYLLKVKASYDNSVERYKQRLALHAAKVAKSEEASQGDIDDARTEASMRMQQERNLEDLAYNKITTENMDRRTPGNIVVKGLSRGNKFGNIGAEYAAARYNFELFDEQRTKSAAKVISGMLSDVKGPNGEPSEKELERAKLKDFTAKVEHSKTRYEAVRPKFLDIISGHQILASTATSEAPAPKGVGFNRDELGKASVVSANQQYIVRKLTNTFGKPVAIKTALRNTEEAYPVVDMSRISLIDPASNQEISKGVSGPVEKLRQAIQDGKFSGKGMYTPTGTMALNSDKITNSGSMLVKEEDVLNALGLDSNMQYLYDFTKGEVDAYSGDRAKVNALVDGGFITVDQVTKREEGANTDAVKETYYRIPVSTDISKQY